MERTPKPFESDDKPDKTGELDSSKKKSKKTRVPLKKTVKKEISKQTDKPDAEPEQPKKTIAEVIEAEKQNEADKKSAAEAPEESEPLELPEVPDETLVIDHDNEFLGELHVDHADVPDSSIEEQAVGNEAGEFETLAEPNKPEGQPVVVERTHLPEAPKPAEKEDQASPPPKVAPPLMFNLPPEIAIRPPEEPSEPEVPAEPEVAPEAPTRPLAEPLYRVQERLRARRAEASRRTLEQNLVPETEVQDREYRAEKRGLSRGVVSGGLAGWLIGRRGRSKLEREATAASKGREEAIKGLSLERKLAAEATDKHWNIIKRTEEELRNLKQRSWDKHVLRRPTPEAVPSVVAAAETAQPIYESARPVFEVQRKTVEKSVSKEKEQTKESMKLPEAAPEYKQINEETYQAPEGRRVETSSWHRIEVDEKTGRAAESPSVKYGEAFKREQQQEKLAVNAAKAQTAAQVGMTVIMGGTEETKTPLAPAEPAPSLPRPQVSLSEVRRETVIVARQLIRNTTSPLTWAAALIIVVLLFLTDIL